MTSKSEFSNAASVVDVPAADRRIVGAGEDEVTDADETIDALLVSAEDRQTDARCHVPLAQGFVDASADDEDLLNDHTGDVVIHTTYVQSYR